MDEELRVYFEGMEQRNTDDIASVRSDVGSLETDMVSVKSEVGSLKTDIVSVKGDIVSLRSEMVSMEARLTTTIDHTQEVLAQVTTRAFDDRKSQLRDVRAFLGAIAEAVDADVPGWKAGTIEAEVGDTYRKDFDGLAHREKQLEQDSASRK